MDFGFNDDQDLLRATTRRFLAEHQSLADVRRSIEEPDPFDAALWRQGAALGWTAMLIPPECGGGSVTGQPLVDLVVLGEELGRTLNPGPFVPGNVVAGAIARFGSDEQASQHLPQLASGEVTAAWCASGDGSPDGGAVEVRADDGGDARWRLQGVARYVQVVAGDATLLLVVAIDPAASRPGALTGRPMMQVVCRTCSYLQHFLWEPIRQKRFSSEAVESLRQKVREANQPATSEDHHGE